MDAHHRSSDPPLKISREVPIEWLLGIVGAILLFGATMHFGQQRVLELVQVLTLQGKETAVRLDALAGELGAKSMRDIQRDMTQADLERRVLAIERAKDTKR